MIKNEKVALDRLSSSTERISCLSTIFGHTLLYHSATSVVKRWSLVQYNVIADSLPTTDWVTSDGLWLNTTLSLINFRWLSPGQWRTFYCWSALVQRRAACNWHSSWRADSVNALSRSLTEESSVLRQPTCLLLSHRSASSVCKRWRKNSRLKWSRLCIAL